MSRPFATTPGEPLEEYLRRRGLAGRIGQALPQQMQTAMSEVAQALLLPGAVGSVIGQVTTGLVGALRERQQTVRSLAGCRRLAADLLEAEPDLDALSFHPHLLAWELARLPADKRVTPVVREEEATSLYALLEKTSLSSIIRASSKITARLEFLTALEHLIFDEDASRHVNERDHLHKIIERGLWLFGEEFNMMTSSEIGLTKVLEHHRRVVGLDTPADGSVRTEDGRLARVDLMLSASTQEHDRVRHLIVELKAPNVKATDVEVGSVSTGVPWCSSEGSIAGAGQGRTRSRKSLRVRVSSFPSGDPLPVCRRKAERDLKGQLRRRAWA
ncbi:hypothetical protein ACIRL2_46005 [Embleya sp. NPDC127516]|uniref:hypothetical protein n=1 Tax=Embleya sp. NPDC127516 TaxID=3363990 RepID=UPI0037FA807A